MRPRKKLNFTIRYVLIFGALLLAANILLGIVLFNQSRHTLREMLEKNMLDITNTAFRRLMTGNLGGIRYDDPDIGIDWPIAPDAPLTLSPKDLAWGSFRELAAQL